MKQLRQSDVTIFCRRAGQVVMLNFLESRGSMGSQIDLSAGENQMKTFAKVTGGFAWFPQFDGEIPGIFQQVASFLRHQYSLTYSPTKRGE